MSHHSLEVFTPLPFFNSSNFSSKKSNKFLPLSSAAAWALGRAGCVLMMKSMSWEMYNKQSAIRDRQDGKRGWDLNYLSSGGLSTFIHPPAGEDGVRIRTPLQPEFISLLVSDRPAAAYDAPHCSRQRARISFPIRPQYGLPTHPLTNTPFSLCTI